MNEKQRRAEFLRLVHNRMNPELKGADYTDQFNLLRHQRPDLLGESVVANSFDASQPRDENGRWSETGGGGMSWKTDKGTDVKLEGSRLFASAGPLKGGHEFDGYGEVRSTTAALLKAKKINPAEYVQLNGHDALFSKSDSDRLDEAGRRATKFRETARAEFAKNVPGYSELSTELAADQAHYEQTRKHIEKGFSALPAKRESKVNELSQKYPVARIYIKAEEYSRASHDQKASAGRRAMERIKKGESALQVEADMENEWKSAADKSAANA